MPRNYKNILAWQRSHEVVLAVYGLTKTFPTDEKFGLTSQIRRAAVSVPANIAEGASRETTADYLRFLTIALGSLSEAEYFLFLAKELEYVSEENHVVAQGKVSQAFATLHGLIKAVKNEHRL